MIYLIFALGLVAVWYGLTEFIVYWATQEQRKTESRPTAPGYPHKRVS